MELRDYQVEDIRRLRDAFRRGARRVLYQLPTGGGKTVVFSEVGKGVHARGKRLLVVAHRRELIKQASRKLLDAGIPHGIIAPWARQTDDLAQVASIQTLGNRDIEPPDVIVTDEAHHRVAPTYEGGFAPWPDAIELGVTATPELLSGVGLGTVYQGMVCGPSIPWLTERGWLSRIRYFGAKPDRLPDLKGVRRIAGDLAAGGVARAMMQPGLIGATIHEYAMKCPGAPAIEFCANVEHAHRSAEQFRLAGWRAVAVDGTTPEGERDSSIAGLSTGAVQVLCSCSLVDEGLDVPIVSAVILSVLTESLRRFLQMIGRGMRPADGKEFLIVLDRGGNWLKHGAPWAERKWSLEGREPGEKAPALRQCPNCWACHEPAPRCPDCGYVYPIEARKRVVIERAGELVELTDAEMNYYTETPLKTLLARAYGAGDDADGDADEKVWEALEAIRKARGYHSNWTRRLYRCRRIAASASARRNSWHE